MKKSLSIYILIAFMMALLPLSVARATTIINFPDSNLASALSSIIGKPASSITDEDMKNLKGLYVYDKNISDLSGIEYATNLETLVIYNNNINDLSPIANLTNLKTLQMQNNPVTDLSPLANLVNMETIELPSNELTNYDVMASMTKLKLLYAPLNNINDLSFMRDMTELQRFDLLKSSQEPYGITDLSPLAGLTKLEYVDLQNNKIADVKPLIGNANLQDLNLSGNLSLSDDDLADIAKFTNLSLLNLGICNITDISSISTLINLRWLGLEANHIKDITPLETLVNLTGLTLDRNDITDLSPLAGLTNLRNNELMVQNNFINVFEGSNKDVLDNLGITMYRDPQQRIALNPAEEQEFTINVGETVQTYVFSLSSNNGSSWVLTNTINGNDLTMTSSDNSIATTGIGDGNAPFVTGVKGGTAQITATYKGINSKYTTTSFNVTVSSQTLQGSITVKYQDENGADIIVPDVVNNLNLGTYTRNAKELQGYTLNDDSTKTIQLTDIAPNQTIVFSYKKDVVPPVIKGSYTVQYKDQDGNILDQETTSNLDLGSYTVKAKSFDGYNLVGEENQAVTLTNDNPNQTIVFTYKKNEIPKPIIKGIITVKYQDENGADIIVPDVVNNLNLGTYTRNAKELQGYTLNDDSTKTIQLTDIAPDQTIVFTYKKNEIPKPIIKGSITVKYQDENGADIAEQEIKEGLDLGIYTENARDLEGYTLSGDEGQSVTLTEDNKDQVITFKYKKNAAPIITKNTQKLPKTGSPIDSMGLMLLGLLMIIVGGVITKVKVSKNK